MRFIILILVLIIASNLGAQTYSWPILPYPSGKRVTSGYCAYRPTYNSIIEHFHEGIDIPEETDPLCHVYPTTLAYKVIKIDTLGPDNNLMVKVIHYTDDTSSVLSEGSKYIHLKEVLENIYEDSIYIGVPISSATDLYLDHLHFEYRTPSDLANSNNPFTITELQIEDNSAPVLCSLYVDYSRQGDAVVACWEYLESNFGQYYSTVTGGGYTFLKLTLPAETPWNDWDDPHFIITGNRKVRFAIKMVDADIVAPYHYYLTIDTAIVDLVGFDYYKSDNHYQVEFDSLLSSEYKQEEAVYHQEEPIVSGWNSQYYRLYPYGTLPSCILKSMTLRTESLEEGQHQIRITAIDYNGNKKTADAHFYIKTSGSDWVDYCRAFTD